MLKNHKIDFVHLDDDDLLRICWSHSAKKAGKQIKSFSNPNELKMSLSTIEKETPFYIDSCLGDGVIEGQDFAKELFEMGYENLYLSTGYEKEKFAEMPWIKDVIGKTPPWDNIKV